ncbi:type II secretion system protein GspD [Verticiella sediminum]|uniref:Type II secretion system protein GspD n=1 Tax=Verticiella sediminum TaxID=1247510 RepID=A0A556ACP8_9BURK|nr:type II secretion system secretin GspD [Verticiella sediminum]TSH90647.1 type II secretion system protein GspD [Verticiella sediminum]
MTSTSRFRCFPFSPFVAACVFAASALGPLPAAAQGTGEAAAVRNPGDVVLNFVDADLDAVVRALGHFTGKTFLIDPRVKGQLTLVSERPVNRDIAYRMLLGALRMQGFAVVETDGIAKVVPEADAKLQGSAVATGTAAPPAAFAGDQLVTRVFTLRHENAANLVPVLRPMVSPNNPVNAYPGNNTLVITDYAGNLNRIAQVIQSIDTPGSTDTDVIALRYAVAPDLAAQLTRLLDNGANDPTQRISVVADARANTLMIRSGSPARTQLARELIARLDTPEAGQTTMHVVTLRNAEAVRLAEVLRGLLTGQSQGGSADMGQLSQAAGGGLGGGSLGGANGAGGGLGGGLGGGSGMGGGQDGTLNLTSAATGGQQGGNAFSAGGATVQADPATNTLIINAPPPIYRNLRSVIEQLDVRRPQVFVESLIVEMAANDAAEFGVQWMAGGGRLDGGSGAFGGTNFGGAGQNLIGVAANPASIGNGLNVGLVRGSVRIGNLNILNLGLLARALESRGNANVLSTPNLLTLNNEEARIMVGRNLPFVTGQYTQTSAEGINPFQTIERQDVGLQLRIRPQVSEGGTIRLAIHQEVSNLDEALTAAMPDLGVVTNKREVSTNVLVDDGQIIVLGGLLEDRMSGGREQVPGLGNIPLLGNLFRYDTRSRTKTNLMIFLRPYVVRGPEIDRFTAERYDIMRAMQGGNLPADHWLLPELGTPTLPPRLPGEGDLTASRGQPLAGGMVIPRDPAAIYLDRGVNVLLAASVASQAQADEIAEQIRNAGFAPYVQVRRAGANPVYQVYIRVAREAATTDAAVGALRQLGYAPELLVRR